MIALISVAVVSSTIGIILLAVFFVLGVAVCCCRSCQVQLRASAEDLSACVQDPQAHEKEIQDAAHGAPPSALPSLFPHFSHISLGYDSF